MRSVLWILGHTTWINDWRYSLQFEFGMNAFQYLSFHKVRKTKSMILKSGIDQFELTNITIRTRGSIYLLSKRIPWKTDIESETKQINKPKTRYLAADIGGTCTCNSIKVYSMLLKIKLYKYPLIHWIILLEYQTEFC